MWLRTVDVHTGTKSTPKRSALDYVQSTSAGISIWHGGVSECVKTTYCRKGWRQRNGRVEINKQRYNGEIPSDTKGKNFYTLLPINITSSQFSQRPALCSKLRKMRYFSYNNTYHRTINNGSHGHG